MPLPLLAMGIPVAAQAILGAWQTLNAVKQAKKNQRPFYNIDPTFQQNIDILSNTMGLPQETMNLLFNRIGQGTSQGIDAILGAGGNPNQVATILNNQNRSLQDVSSADALQRKQDLNNLINARLMLAGERDKAFQINEYAPFADKAAAISMQKQAGLQNIGGAFNSASGMFANKATMDLAEQLFNLNPANQQRTGGATGAMSGALAGATTPNSGVNVNKIYQDMFPPMTFNTTPPSFSFSNNQNALGMFNPNAMSISNLPQAPQIPFGAPPPFQPFNNSLYFSPNQQPINLSSFNPSQLSLYNNPYSFSF